MNNSLLAVPDHIRGLIFDCDGTLADTMSMHWETWHEEFAARGLICPQSFLDDRKGMAIAEIVRDYNHAFQTDLNAVEFAIHKENRSLEKIPKVKPIQPVANIVHTYKGKLPMAVVSGGNRTNVVKTIEVIGLKEAFETVLTSDDGFPSKPAPDIFIEAARRIDIPPEQCLVYEDGDFGIEAAENAGMTAVDIRPLLIGTEYST